MALLRAGGYGLDAYQLITTDVMEVLARYPYDFHVEIVDDWLFLYAPTSHLTDIEFWTEVDELANEVASKLARRRYVDEHELLPEPSAEPGTPASPGRRGRRLAKRDHTGRDRAGAVVGWVLVLLPVIVMVWVMLQIIPH